MERNPAHGCALLQAAGPAGKGQLQFPGNGLGIIEKQLVKIPQPKQNQTIRIFFLNL